MEIELSQLHLHITDIVLSCFWTGSVLYILGTLGPLPVSSIMYGGEKKAEEFA